MYNGPKVEVGDILFVDSEKRGAKIVKFLMTAPTAFQYIWRKIRGTQEKVYWYHPLMVFNNAYAIEAQWTVDVKDLNKPLNTLNNLLVVRRRGLSAYDRGRVALIAAEEVGQYWGVIHALFGRFGTWLTGIPFFARYIKLPNNEVSVGRVLRWHYKAFGDTFGSPTYQEATTHSATKYILDHPEIYEIIYDSRKTL